MIDIRRLAAKAAIPLLLSLSLTACEKLDRNMWDNPAFGPQKAPVRVPPEGSVPTKGMVHRPSMEQASALSNPVAGSAPDIANGHELFGIFCVPCHGPAGKGDGPVGKKYKPTPSNIGPGGITSGMTDGAIFGVIGNGSGGMPSLAPDLPMKDRWRIVAWIRSPK